MEETKKTQSPMAWVLGQTGDYGRQYVLSVVLAVIGVAFSLAPYFVVIGIVQGLMGGVKDFSFYLSRCLIMAAFWLGRVLFHALSTSTSHKATFAVLGEMRKRCMEKLTRMPLGTVLEQSSGALKNTLILSVMNILLFFPAPIILALLLNEVRKAAFKRVVQTVSYLPNFVSWVVVVMLLRTILTPYGGIVNDIRKKVLVFIIYEVAHADNGADITDIPHHRTEVDADRNVHRPGLVKMPEVLDIDPLRNVLHTRPVLFFEYLAVFQQKIIFGRNGRHAWFNTLDIAVTVLYAYGSVRERFERL